MGARMHSPTRSSRGAWDLRTLIAVPLAYLTVRFEFRGALLIQTLGVLPLVKASGAGAATQHSVGTGILGGMLAATLIGVFFTPVFYKLIHRQKAKKADASTQSEHSGSH